jgi:hypothetical protein
VRNWAELEQLGVVRRSNAPPGAYIRTDIRALGLWSWAYAEFRNYDRSQTLNHIELEKDRKKERGRRSRLCQGYCPR